MKEPIDTSNRLVVSTLHFNIGDKNGGDCAVVFGSDEIGRGLGTNAINSRSCQRRCGWLGSGK